MIAATDPFIVALPLEVPVWSDYYTCGDYATEVESVAAFDAIINTLGYFKVLREVTGQYLQLNLDQEYARPRIDRLLVPTTDLRQLGWDHGVIGVECKRSNEKIGRPISQMLDYRRAVYPVLGVHVLPRYVLLWPWNGCSGPIESIMAQQRLGHINNVHGTLHMTSGKQNLATFIPHLPPLLSSNIQGRKTGSR